MNEIQTYELSSQILHLTTFNIMQVNKIQARSLNENYQLTTQQTPCPLLHIKIMKTKFAHLTWRKSNIYQSHTNVKLLVKVIRATSSLYRLLLRNLKSRPCNHTLIIMVASKIQLMFEQRIVLKKSNNNIIIKIASNY